METHFKGEKSRCPTLMKLTVGEAVMTSMIASSTTVITTRTPTATTTTTTTKQLKTIGL